MTEKLIREGKTAGALGGKLIGSGFGGYVLLYCPGTQIKVAQAVQNCGGNPYIVQIDKGIRVDFKK